MFSHQLSQTWIQHASVTSQKETWYEREKNPKYSGADSKQKLFIPVMITIHHRVAILQRRDVIAATGTLCLQLSRNSPLTSELKNWNDRCRDAEIDRQCSLKLEAAAWRISALHTSEPNSIHFLEFSFAEFLCCWSNNTTLVVFFLMSSTSLFKMWLIVLSSLSSSSREQPHLSILPSVPFCSTSSDQWNDRLLREDVQR